jgi:hypothetical protein
MIGNWIISIAWRFLLLVVSPRPHIKKEGALLVLESGWRTSLLTLGGRKRRVVVDVRSRVIRIQDRRFWLISTRQAFEFGQVREVLYGYRNWAQSSWISDHSDDVFSEFTNNSIWPDWMLWDEFVIGKVAKHDMDSQAMAVAEVLSNLLQVPIGGSLTT